MKHFLLISFLLLFCHLGFAEKAGYKEELQKALAQSKQDTNRLSLLQQLTTAFKYDPQEQLLYTDRLLQEAERQKNDKYKCKAYLTHIIVAYNDDNFQEAEKWLALLEPLARKEKLYDLYFEGKQLVTDLLSQKQEYELEEKEASQMLEEARLLNNAVGMITASHSLARCYAATYRSSKALESLERGIDLAIKHDKPLLLDELLSTTSIVCEQLEAYEKWIKYLRMKQNNIQKLKERFPNESFDGTEMISHIFLLRYYTSQKLWNAAKKYLNLAESSYSTYPRRTTTTTYYYLSSKYYYHFQREEWSMALEEIEKILPIIREISEVTYLFRLAQKAELLTFLNMHEESSDIYKQIKQRKDSLEVSTINKQTEQLKESYKTNLLLLEKENRRNQSQQTFLILAGIVLGILVLFIYHAIKTKRQLVKAEQEMKQMMEETEQSNMIKERFLSNINMSISPLLESIVKNSTLLVAGNELSLAEKIKLSAGIGNTSDQLMELIDEILLLSKLEAGIMRFTIKDVDICKIVKEAVDGTGLQMRQTVEAGCMIEGDRAYLKGIVDSIVKIPSGNNENISITIEQDGEANIRIVIQNTLLATSKPSQEIVVRNEINRMLVAAFHGKYEVSTVPGNCSVSLTFKQSATRKR